MLNGLMCSLRGHRVNRKHVWHDGIDFRGRCKRCETEMIRDVEGWRLYDTELDENAKRAARPSS